MTTPHPALDLIRPGHVVGLGTGRSASAFMRELGEAIRGGLDVRGVTTSRASTELARSLGIPLVSLDDVDSIDVAFDGADEVDPSFNLIKGRGGALVREKIVAAAAKKFVVLVGPEKLVATLGQGGALPVEVVPFALGFCRRKIAALGCSPSPRKAADGSLYISDNGNPILDCHIAALYHPAELERAILDLPGVIDTGLFLGMAHDVIVVDGPSARVLQRSGS